MWTPNKKRHIDPTLSENRLCYTEAKTELKHPKTIDQEAKEPTEAPSTHIQATRDQAKQEESKNTDSNNVRKTVKIRRINKLSEKLLLGQRTNGKEFIIYKDSDIGLKDIAGDIIETTMDDDVKTTSALLRRAERECIRDLQQAINFRKDLDRQDEETSGNA